VLVEETHGSLGQCVSFSLIDVESGFTAYVTLKRKEKKRKNYASSKKLITSIKEKGPLGKKSPFTRKKKEVSEDQEGCGQTSQQTSPDWFEGEENAQENVWSEQAYEHSAQNEHGA